MIHPILSPPRLVALVVTILVSAFASPALADVVPNIRGDGPLTWPVLGLILSLAFAGLVGVYSGERRRSSRRDQRGPYRTLALREFVERREAAIRMLRPRAAVWGARLAVVAVLSVAFAIEAGALPGCSPAVDAEIAADASAFASALPVGCAIVNAVDGSVAGQVCGSVSSAVQGAAGILQGILNALSPVTSKAPTSGPLAVAPPVVWVLGSGKAGVTVTIRADLAPQVVDAAKAKRPATKKGGGA